MGRNMISYVDWLLAKTTAELRYARYRSMVERPKHVLVDCRRALLNTNLNEICQKIILPQEILLQQGFI